MNIRFLEPARNELDDAFAWYEMEQSGLGLKKVTKESAFRRCARHLCCRLSEMSTIVAEMNQSDLLNAGVRGPMDSAPWGMPIAKS